HVVELDTVDRDGHVGVRGARGRDLRPHPLDIAQCGTGAAGRGGRFPTMSRKTLMTALGTLVVVIVVAIILNLSGGGDALGTVAAHAGTSYLGIAGLVFGDAICPVFPGETTLNAGATLAAQGTLDLLPVIIAGAVGAVLGDSALYWLARLFSDHLSEQVEKARQNDKVASALDLLGSSAP